MPLVIDNLADIVVPAGINLGFWIDDIGKVYLGSDANTSHTYDFSTACLGPV